MAEDRAGRVRAELAELATQARADVTRAKQRCAEATRAADESTGRLSQSWKQRIQAMRARPGAARADWRNDQMTDGQR
ncbi:hypothetical protein [Labedaea rhizosphaerae]|uniref:Uncharacterized protein n=1 Tax=Labedaea rhizosphaerae TaxID=598644 RepID=A0A4R6S928_LABRH|nr:hypothetical protein [Labedaea rhizosphaerae]TDP96412.1 hypothetical protein EV186_104399 [Labedaea rhizosphaerae]